MSNYRPLVSICMPVFNAGNYILAAIQSVLDQSYDNWELIIINDGSTDHTITELEKIADRNIKIYHQENKGQSNAANKAYAYSKGELVKFMDADDLISSDYLQSQVNILNGTLNTIASASWGRFYRDDLGTFSLSKNNITQAMHPIDWLVTSMSNDQVMLQCALWLIPRSILENSGLWNEELSLINDFEFFIRVFTHANEIRYAPNAILYYRSGLDNSLSGLRSLKGATSAYHSIELGTTHLFEMENSPRIRKIAADCFQSFIYDYYPLYPNLITMANRKVVHLGGSSLKIQASGYSKFLLKIGGWKFMKRLKYLFFKHKS